MKLLRRTGSLALQALTALRGVTHVGWRSVYFIFRGRSERQRTLQYMYIIGNQSLVFLVVVMGFIGMIVVYQAGIQLARVIPDMSQLGSTFLELLIKDTAASICGLMLATRVGAGIAAEIGSMRVTEQIDALRLSSADPIDYLIRPRFIASLLMTPALVVVAAGVAAVTGMWTAQIFFQVSTRTFFDFRHIDVGDVAVGLSKCFAYGAAIPIISGYCGLQAFGGSEGVGRATTHAVVHCSLAIVVLNFALSSLGYLLFE